MSDAPANMAPEFNAVAFSTPEVATLAFASPTKTTTLPSVICDVPGEFVMLRNMPAVSMNDLNNSLLMRIPHSAKHIFNPNQQDIQLQPGRHDAFSQELFRCEFAYLANILSGDSPDTCDIIIRLVHSSARRARNDYATRLLQIATIMLGNEFQNYLDQCHEKAKRTKKAPDYYKAYVRRERKPKADKTSKTATPPPRKRIDLIVFYHPIFLSIISPQIAS